MKYNFCPKCGEKYSQQKHADAFVCTGCGFVFYLNSKPTACALIVDDQKLLLGKRSIEPAKGKWDIIGGFLGFGEHPAEGTKREVREETGLEVEIESVLGFFMDTYGDTGDVTLNICFIARVISGNLKPGDDIEELRWFSLHEIPKEIAFRNGQEMIDAWLKTEIA